MSNRRAEERNRLRAIKKMSLAEFDNYYFALIKNTMDLTLNLVEESLKDEYNFGKIRTNRIREAVDKKITQRYGRG